MSNNIYVDLHVLQNVPPSCINRDDTGSPKTAIYGGVIRARVSSQAWKASMRKMFRDLFPDYLQGLRTKNITGLVKKEIQSLDDTLSDENAEKISDEILMMAGIKSGDDKKGVLFFISSQQVKALAELAIEYNSSDLAKKQKEKTYKPKVAEALIANPGIDMLMFGRMAASNPTLNYDAAAQVAHSISTHTVSNEYDYFTAVDDCSPDDNAGAGHLGTVEYNSSTLYRYATVNVGELTEKLSADEINMAVRGFVEAFIRSMPTGKQNTFANRTLPEMVYIAVRRDQPINMVGAFEKPIYTQVGGYLEPSKKAFVDYANHIYEIYDNAPEKAWAVGVEDDSFAEKVNINELLDALEGELHNE